MGPEQRQALLLCLAFLLLSVGWQSYRELGSPAGAGLKEQGELGSSWIEAAADGLSRPVPAREAAAPLQGASCTSFKNHIPTGALAALPTKQPSLEDCCAACRAQLSPGCNAFVYCAQQGGCYSSSPVLAGNMTTLPYQGCALLYQGLSDARTGRPLLAIRMQGFMGGAPITASALPVENYTVRVGLGFFNRHNYACAHPGRLTAHSCMLRGTPKELAPLCDADPRCRVMVHLSHGWDYNALNMTEFKGGWGVEMTEPDGVLNNNVASYFKLTPPVAAPPEQQARSSAVFAGIVTGACVGLAAVALMAALLPWRQAAPPPAAVAPPSGDSSLLLHSDGSHSALVHSDGSHSALLHSSGAGALGAGRPPLSGGSRSSAGKPPRPLHDSAQTSLLQQQHQQPPPSGGRTASWVAAAGSRGERGSANPSPTPSQEQRVQRNSADEGPHPGTVRTKTAPWLAVKVPSVGGSSRVGPPSSLAGTPLAGAAAAGTAGTAAAAGAPPSRGSLQVSSPFARSTLERDGDGSEAGDEAEAAGSQSKRPLDLHHVHSAWDTAAAAALPAGGEHPAPAAPAAGGSLPGSSGGGDGGVAGSSGQNSSRAAGKGQPPLPPGAAPQRSSGDATGVAPQPPAPALHLAPQPSLADTPKTEAPGDPPAAPESGSSGTDTAVSDAGVLRPGASWQEGVEALQALGSDDEWPSASVDASTLGMFETPLIQHQPTATQLLAKLPEVHWEDWVVDPQDVEFCCKPDGSYQELGSGGFGTVYKVVLDGVQLYAAKVLDLGLTDLHVQNIFLREASLLRRLRHRNIVGFRGVAIMGGKGMLLMEMMEGGDLYHRLLTVNKNTQHRLFGWYARGKRVALDVARGIHYLHSLHLTHFDIKSSNCLMTRDLTCKIADVGFTRLMDHTHHSVRDSRTGTFDYMAPELLMGQACNQAVDIYSFGILLWEICSGEHPLRGRNRELRVPQECPQEMVDLVEQCTSMDPAARPSARELVERLTRLGALPCAADRF